MKKRMFCLAVALVFLLTLNGCGTTSDGGGSQDESGQAEASQTAQADKTEDGSGIRSVAARPWYF